MKPWIPAFAGMTAKAKATAATATPQSFKSLDSRVRGNDEKKTNSRSQPRLTNHSRPRITNCLQRRITNCSQHRITNSQHPSIQSTTRPTRRTKPATASPATTDPISQ
ncbi:hypothetical protein [Lysobacter capsici]|uniref:hypothetical protein n=1 Tax=Lysobacter capsici TaxID=435897 RepID=UPI001BFFE455|nr:hypothetical protein [Lysobacter capsici]QWF18811.1 hypothetical protein KME82_08745 [Lysobacter capsici]